MLIFIPMQYSYIKGLVGNRYIYIYIHCITKYIYIYIHMYEYLTFACMYPTSCQYVVCPASCQCVIKAMSSLPWSGTHRGTHPPL